MVLTGAAMRYDIKIFHRASDQENLKTPIQYGKGLYKQRHKIENMFGGP